MKTAIQIIGSVIEHLFADSEQAAQRPRTLEDIGYDDLRREQIRLEREEKRALERFDALEEQKRDLFVQGKDEGSRRMQAILARKIKALDTEAKNLDRNLALISKQLRIVGGFLQIKTSQRLYQSQDTGLFAHIAHMDLSQLEGYVDQASIDGQLQMDKLGRLIGVVEGEDLEMTDSQDPDVEAIMEAMQAAKAAEEMGEQSAVESEMGRVKDILDQEEGLTRDEL